MESFHDQRLAAASERRRQVVDAFENSIMVCFVGPGGVSFLGHVDTHHKVLTGAHGMIAKHFPVTVQLKNVPRKPAKDIERELREWGYRKLTFEKAR